MNDTIRIRTEQKPNQAKKKTNKLNGVKAKDNSITSFYLCIANNIYKLELNERKTHSVQRAISILSFGRKLSSNGILFYLFF